MSLFSGSLTTGNLFNGGLFNGGLFYSVNGEIFNAPLTTTLVPLIGNYVPTFTRSTAASVTDFEGIIRTAKIGEARFGGARRVENLYANSETLTTQSISVAAGTYTVSFTGTGTITFSGAYSGSLVGTGTSNRVEKTFSASNGTLTSTVSGSVLRAQCENVSGQSIQTASEYVSTGLLSFPYHGTGVDGVKCFSTKRDGNIINDSTIKGFFAEGQRTNLAFYSNEFSNVYWDKLYAGTGTAPVITSNYSVSPDGKQNAFRLQCSKSGTLDGSYSLLQKSLTLGGYTGSLWVKSNTGVNQNVYFRVNGPNIYSVTNQWTRVKLYDPAANYITIGVRGTSDDTIDISIFSSQYEGGTYESSIVNTTSSSVTRNADNLKYILGLPKEGTVYAEVNASNSNSGSGILLISAGIGPLNYNSDTGISLMDGTNTHVLTYGQPFSTGTRKIAARWSNTTGTMKLFKDGGASADGAYAGTFHGGTEILIGQQNFFGCIRNIKIWDRVLSDAELMGMTL